jgi:Rrf2 family protein
MKLSTRSTYGMRALIELAFAAGHGPVSAAHIAHRQALSVAYLEQLLHRLKRQGMVTSIRGPRGGYLLAKPAGQITMAAIVRILDSQTNGVAGQSVRVVRGTTASAHAQRIAHTVQRCVHERLTASLEGITLEDLCEEVRAEAGEPLDHRYVFHI